MRVGMLAGLRETAPGPPLPKAPSGVAGLDDITEGGLPRGRVTLLAGGAGSGKTLIGLTFLVAGATEHGEPGVLLTFEEPTEKVATDVRSLGFELEELQREGRLAVLSFQLDPTDIITAGEFSLEPLFLSLAEAVRRVGRNGSCWTRWRFCSPRSAASRSSGRSSTGWCSGWRTRA